MQNNNLVSSFNILRNKSFRKTIGTSLFFTSFALGITQGAEISKTQENLFAERNNEPYTLEDFKARITPILDKEIEDDFWPFIEALFEPEFIKDNPIPHSPLAVFKNCNRFFDKLNKAKDKKRNEGDHPQILVLRGDIICHHYDIFEKKYPHLTQLKSWLG